VKERSIKERHVHPIEEERRFLDVLKLIVEAGWMIKEKDFFEMLETI
jgi:hypothetical protein